MKRICLIAVLCLLLTGCTGWMDYSYHSVTPHMDQGQQGQEGLIQVSTYSQLTAALEAIVEDGADSRLLDIGGYNKNTLESHLDSAVKSVMEQNPIAAYAVESITYELGTSGGLNVVLATVTYNHNRGSIQRIRHLQTPEEAMELITTALEQCEAGVTVRLDRYLSTDFAQMIQDYAQENPQTVMEAPQVEVHTYPESGIQRVVELQFTYQNSREDLRTMQVYVQPVFSAARMYVTADAADSIKYAQLYAFLMERYDYTIETSITPSYSLLRYGVGDSKAFAMVYSAMCRNSGLECLVVSGTSDGEPRYWNIIQEDGVYYHVDLLRSNRSGEMTRMTDEEMQGYVWDYSAYPACGPAEEDPTVPAG